MGRYRDERITIRVTAEEKALIRKKMKENGFRNVTDFFVWCIGKHRTTVIDTTPILEVKTEINRIGNNINQIAKVANTVRWVDKDMMSAVVNGLKEIKQTVNAAFRVCTKERGDDGVYEDSTG